MTKKLNPIDWFIRLIKGIFIGTGFILPGVSGGALAAIFGLYERMIEFMAHIRRDFKSNLIFFIPVIIGMFAGIVILAYPLDYFLSLHLGPTMWFFIGAIIGTVPSLWSEAGKKGRKPLHIFLMLAVALAAFFLLNSLSQMIDGQLPLNPLTWMLAGGIIALGVLIPGLSASNLLLYAGMYSAMVEGFKALDFSMIIPLIVGGVAVMLIFAKIVNWLFETRYTGLFHVILGFLIASTVMIIPLEYDYTSPKALWCIPTFILGLSLGLWMSKLEKNYK